VRRVHAATRSWRELFVAAPVGDVVVEGYVDLLGDTPDGLLLVDYKTDAVHPSDLDRTVIRYRPQAAAYALALESATGQPVASCTFVFARPDGSTEREVDDLAGAIAEVRAFLGVG
jgi:ATP-dependent helicase/nuclease subunit A